MVRWSALGLILLLTGCAAPRGDAIVFAVANAPTVLDPRLATDAASERVNALLYAQLVTLDEAGQPQAAMADWQMITPTHYRVRLRPERMPFWDGTMPSAKDVVETYRSVLDPANGSPHMATLAHIAQVRAHGEDQVDFRLKRPDPRFPARLTLGIVPASAIGTRQIAREPLGSGPLAFLRWREDGGVVLRRRADGQQIAFVPVSDPTMRALKLLRGEADLVQNDLPGELYAFLADQPGVEVREYPGTTFTYIGFNLADPVLSNETVRAAIAHAIDRDAIIRHLFGGRAQVAESVLRAEHWAGADALPPVRYDPAEARRLLRDAGYSPEHPLQLGYKTSTDPFRQRIAHVVQSQLAEVGIQLKISSYDWGTFFGDIKAGRFQMYSLAWVGVNTPDILRYAFHSASVPPGGANRGRYRSARVDAWIESAEAADLAEAAELYARVQNEVHGDLVYVPLWYESNVVASRGLDRYRPGRDGNYLALTEVRQRNAAGH